MKALRLLSGSGLAVVVAGLVALVTHQLWLFPGLGPTIMSHVEMPDAPESSPRNALIGHAVALIAGYVFLVVCGLRNDPSMLRQGVSAGRIVAAAGALGVTTAALYLLRAPHPPAWVGTGMPYWTENRKVADRG